jgi:hypothetical protein
MRHCHPALLGGGWVLSNFSYLTLMTDEADGLMHEAVVCNEDPTGVNILITGKMILVRGGVNEAAWAVTLLICICDLGHSCLCQPLCQHQRQQQLIIYSHAAFMLHGYYCLWLRLHSVCRVSTLNEATNG